MAGPLPRETVDQVVALLADGESDLGIHRTLGVGRATAARYRERCGFPKYRTSMTSPTCRHGHPFPQYAARTPQKGWLYCRECLRLRGTGGEPDPVAVERAVCGESPLPKLTRAERAAALRRLTGTSAAEAAHRVGCSPRTVYRFRRSLRVNTEGNRA